MRVVVALGGNALLRRGEPLSIGVQRGHVQVACDHLAPIARRHELVVSHGNGPQIGVLAEQDAADDETMHAPLDVLGAETQGMIGYLIEQELGNRLPADRPLATLLTMIEVDLGDPGFADPTKPIGPRYSPTGAERLAAERGWTFKPDGDRLRRVVASPAPRRIVEQRPIRWLLEAGCVVICAGGGGIPTAAAADGALTGVEAVIDKDRASALLAADVDADLLVLATDVRGVHTHYGQADQRTVAGAHPDRLLAGYGAEFAAGSMLPKVTAACDFARATGRPAVIGALEELEAMVAGAAGTRISAEVAGVVFSGDGAP